ncbi:MAG TPA: metalloregulator ArsR/SmtB family transcription factor [Armatimonadaceae bacterium]|nr:metalloregulator ArsR/SmtB family transcription factor [Armatimonadaceae bacterium]
MSPQSDVFQAIADPTRRALLTRLASDGEVPVAELSRGLPSPMTLSAVSQHLRVLRDAGLVSVRKAGRERYYRLNADPLREVAEWTRAYEAFWPERLDRLGAYLEGKKESTAR